MEEPEGVVKRKLKLHAYRKARRLMRIGHRKIGHVPGRVLDECNTSIRELNPGILLIPPPEKEEIDHEALRKQRLEKNKEWRRKKEIEKYESCGLKPPPTQEEIDEKNRKIARKIEKKLHKEFLCCNCRCELVNEAWECCEGHLTCGDCFDKDNIGIDINEDNTDDELEGLDVVTALKTIRKSSKITRKSSSIDSLKRCLKSSSNTSIATLASIDTIISLRETLAGIAEGDDDSDSKSFRRYLVNEIDFFLNTLEVRKDAIDFYTDYNNQYKSIFYNPDLEGISLDGSCNEGFLIKNNAYVDEKSERVKTYIERLKDQGSLASLREALVDVIETNDNEIDPAWAKFRLEEIDFFLNTLNIRKDAIGYYGDYHNDDRPIFDYFHNDSENDGNDNEEAKTEDDEAEQDDDSDDIGDKITRCCICNNFILRRNMMVEKLARVFFQC